VSWLGRAGARLLPAGRRNWAEALWAEAHEAPAGWPRLAWRAGGVWLIAKEAPMVRWIGSRVLFAAAAGAAAWAAWPAGPAATVRADVIATVLLLAGLPLLARRFFGPPDNRAARRLRAGCYAAILALMPAKAATELFLGAVPRGGTDLRTYDVTQCPNAVCLVPGTSTGPTAASEVLLLVLTACGLAVILTLTARRLRVAPATLAIGACAGLGLGAAMYAVDPLGFNKYVTAPWLRGTWADKIPAGLPQYLVALAWILLFGAPLAAGFLAGWCHQAPGTPEQLAADRVRQGVTAGLVSGGVAALFVTVLGTGTTALLVKSAWVRGELYRGQHLTAATVYGRELFAAQNVTGYFIFFAAFPIVALAMALTGAGVASAIRLMPEGGGPGGPPGPEPAPDPPDGGRLADPGADQDGLPGRDDGDDGEGGHGHGPPGLVGAGLGRLP
jgi:hypothetical protein